MPTFPSMFQPGGTSGAFGEHGSDLTGTEEQKAPEGASVIFWKIAIKLCLEENASPVTE
jgi:hypothetical protein